VAQFGAGSGVAGEGYCTQRTFDPARRCAIVLCANAVSRSFLVLGEQKLNDRRLCGFWQKLWDCGEQEAHWIEWATCWRTPAIHVHNDCIGRSQVCDSLFVLLWYVCSL